MDTARNIPIIKRVEDCIPAGNWSAVSRALFLAQKGRKVILVTPSTYLCEEICDSLRYYLHELPVELQERVKNHTEIHDGKKLYPDQFKRYLEELCDSHDIQIIYGARVADAVAMEKGLLIRIGGKFGLAGIETEVYHGDFNPESFIKKEAGYNEKILSYRSYLGGKEQNGVEYDLLELYLEAAVTGNSYRDIQSLKKNLMDLYKLKKTEDSNLRLGRFALKPITTGSKGIIIPKNVKEVSVISHNAFTDWGKYPLEKTSPFIKGESNSYELVVVGGGTSGSMAALYGARSGLKTVLIEPNLMLGGTGTIGGVSTYWFGKRFKPVLEIDEAVGKIKEELELTGRNGIWSESDDSHPNVRDYVLGEKCIEAGVEIICEHTAYGMCKDENGRLGVATLGVNGNQFFYGDYIYDATGDGDLAAFLNTQIFYGSKRDCITYWGSLAQFTSIDTYKNNFSSMVLCGDPLDYSKFIRLGRKRGGKVFDHGSYISMRESRHIQVEKLLDLKDWLSFNDYDDAVYTCYSNYDPKGKLDADIIYQGILPQQSEALVPLRALCPLDQEGQRIQGLYVLGKAISATHNVFPGLRMQPDLMQQGAVMGILAGFSRKKGCTIETLSSNERKEQIRKTTGDPLELKPNKAKGNISVEAAFEELESPLRTHWVDVDFTYEETEKSQWIGLYLEEKKSVRPFLERKWEENIHLMDSQFKRQLAHLLLWHGSQKSKAFVISTLREELKESLPERVASVMCAQLLPDHGVMPETVYSLNTLSNVKDAEIVGLFEMVVEHLVHMERDYQDIRKGIYHYIESVAYVAERTGIKEFENLLIKLTKLDEFKGLGEEAKSEELLTERLQILYFILARALARLGNAQGYRILIDIISMASLSVQYSAAMELAELLQINGTMDVNFLKIEIGKNSLVNEIQIVRERKW